MSFQVSGTVVDNATGGALAGATIQDLTNSVNSQVTGADGSFTITVPDATTPVSIFQPGYMTLETMAGALTGQNKLLAATVLNQVIKAGKTYWWVLLLIVGIILIMKYKPNLLKG